VPDPGDKEVCMNRLAGMVGLIFGIFALFLLPPVARGADIVLDNFEGGGQGLWQYGIFSGWAMGSFSIVTSPVIEGSKAADLYYDLKLPDGTAFVWIGWVAAALEDDSTFSMWVYGDNSGKRLMVEWYDETGIYALRKTEHDFVVTPYWDNFIDWTGWEHLTAPVPGTQLERLNIFISNYGELGASSGHIYVDNIRIIAPPSPFNLSQGWSMFSPGGYGSILWSVATIRNGNSGETKSITDAEAAGWIQGTIYYFDSDIGLFKTVPGDENDLEWYRGYLIYSNLNNLTLNLQ
jgi:hypothetical protein